MYKGKFIISLDFELNWGIRDKAKKNYEENILGVQKVIPRLLDMFTKYNIKATFSTVGFLFFKDKNELLSHLPNLKPQYINTVLSPYNGYFNVLNETDEFDYYHFAPHLINLIQQYPEQEIGSHTFSHYYCLEKGQTVLSFKDDLLVAIKIAKERGVIVTSLIFPRNQINEDYLKECSNLGIICYRGNEHSWLYAAKDSEHESLWRRCFRLIDAYINISGHNCYTDEYIISKYPMDIAASRFLRPYLKIIKFFDELRLLRIQRGMTYAAKNNMTYHLWWHPHNFGINQDENFAFLEKILIHYKYLNLKYNFESYTMTALAKSLKYG